MSKPVLLDAFCCAGGAAHGYQQAGFYVIGCEIRPQPQYIGDEFYEMDAFEFIAKFADRAACIHASPPCQGYSVTRHIHGNEYPMLIPDIRKALEATGRPYVIENVIGAPLDGITLCGTMFGLKTYRHRIFESNILLMQPPHAKHRERVIQTGRPAKEGQFMTVAGHIASVDYARRIMGIDWMNRNELSQAIPPAYTKFIGQQLMAAIGITQ